MPDYRMKWIRIWPHAWFDSSMRVELTNAERAFWVDVIALAGKSRIAGVICSDPEGKIGYPLPMLSSLLVSWTPNEVTAILEKLEKTQRVQVTRLPLMSGEDGWIVRVSNWQKYQSEAQRVQKYRNTARSERRNRGESTPERCTTGRIEVEVEKEEDVEEEGKPSTLARAKDIAFETFKAKFGNAPAWDTSDYTALSKLFKRIPTLSFEEFNRRWANFLYSEDAFEVNQGGRLRYFCANFDRFMQEKKSGEPTKTQQRSRTNAQVVSRVFGPMDSGAGRALPSGTQRSPSPTLPKRTR